MGCIAALHLRLARARPAPHDTTRTSSRARRALLPPRHHSLKRTQEGRATARRLRDQSARRGRWDGAWHRSRQRDRVRPNWSGVLPYKNMLETVAETLFTLSLSRPCVSCLACLARSVMGPPRLRTRFGEAFVYGLWRVHMPVSSLRARPLLDSQCSCP